MTIQKFYQRQASAASNTRSWIPRTKNTSPFSKKKDCHIAEKLLICLSNVSYDSAVMECIVSSKIPGIQNGISRMCRR